MIDRFELTDGQAEAILNMRLRALRKLEELEIRKEHGKLLAPKRKEENTVANLALSLPNVVRELNRENLDQGEVPRLRQEGPE